MPESPFHHIALNVDEETQAGIEKRLRAAGYRSRTFTYSSTAIAARSTSGIRTA